ncbi:MAG: hypothetical protein ACXWRE_10660, partial [Pseudobdellovibrionaceae bacterium]
VPAVVLAVVPTVVLAVVPTVVLAVVLVEAPVEVRTEAPMEALVKVLVEVRMEILRVQVLLAIAAVKDKKSVPSQVLHLNKRPLLLSRLSKKKEPNYMPTLCRHFI